MSDNIVTKADMKNTNEFFQKALLRRVKYDSVFEQFALKGNVVGMEYVSWFRVNRIKPSSPSQLGDDNPSPLATTTSKVTGQVGWYGAYAKIGRKAKAIDPVKATLEYTEVVGDHGRETREMIMRDAIVSDASITHYSSGADGRSNVIAEIKEADLKKLFRTLEKKGAEKITEIVTGADRDNTHPVEACYVMVISADQAFDVRGLGTAFTKCADYSNPSVRFKNEIGNAHGFRFIVSNFMDDLIILGGGGATVTGKQATGEGSAARCDVHRAIALGKEAFGIADLESLESILKGEKEAGGPLNMYSTTGYIMAMTAKGLNDDWFAILESAVSA